ncbi:hypothetical protein GQ44DRAFT_733684 [Phaeosphaeriaceae sp. PMI808]|nr:hypothetical protein GQ44DRAFT_733684 [Phaeosphaeriaceae sp. PMI808]
MAGGSTLLGSGPPRSYGRGEFYGGGAAVPYQAGTRTPKGLAAAPLISGAVLALMPEIWLHSVYPYYYNNSYHLWNRTANATNNNSNDARVLIRRQDAVGASETLPVVTECPG